MQVVLESPRDGRHYVFELNDRLIRDMELDGLTEIPVKPSPGIQQLKPVSDDDDRQADEREEFVPSMLQGHFCIHCINGISCLGLEISDAPFIYLFSP